MKKILPFESSRIRIPRIGTIQVRTPIIIRRENKMSKSLLKKKYLGFSST
jgi:hypothetical protein